MSLFHRSISHIKVTHSPACCHRKCKQVNEASQQYVSNVIH